MTPRIAYMTGQYPRATDTFIQREVAALRERGVHVETLSVRKPAIEENVGPEQQAERDATHYLLPPCPWELFKAHAGAILKSPGRYFSALRLAFKARSPGLKALALQMAYFAEAGLVARRMQAHTLVHLHNHFSDSSCSVAMLAAEMGGFSFSLTMHGPAEFFEPHRWRIDQKIRRAKFVCCISHFCRSQAMIFSPQEKWDRLHIIHCGVDPNLFVQARHRERGRRILFVGRLAAVKGVPVLLEAIARLRPAHDGLRLVIAGDGPDRKSLEQMARQLNVSDNVEFVGYQSQSQVRQLLTQTDVFAMGSFAEGVPVVLMEAMAAGVPVVATHIAGIPELIQDGESGFLVPPGDSETLADRIGQLLEDPALRNRFASAGRRKVEIDFNLAHESRRLCDVLTSALNGEIAPVRPDLAVEAEQPAAPMSPAVPVSVEA